MKIQISHYQPETRLKLRLELLMKIVWFDCLLFTSLPAKAAAPVYFDIIGALFIMGLYLLGFLAFPFAIYLSKEKTTKRIWTWIFICHIFAPIVYIATGVITTSIHNKNIEIETESGEKINIEAFGKYCQNRKKIIHTKPTQQASTSIVIRFEEDFMGGRPEFNAISLVDHIRNQKDFCKKTNLRLIEGFYDGAYSEDKVYRQKIYRNALCINKEAEVIPKSTARYELVLGEASHRDPAPWGNGSQTMANSSIRIMDKLNGNILAEDTMYFLNNSTGEAGCPSGKDQISSLLTEVFSTP